MADTDRLAAAARLAEALAELRNRERRQLRRHYFPDQTHEFDGRTFFARELYAKHCAFFRAGADYPERCFLASNRSGKSEAAAYETACHVTGDYPDWWEGRRFPKPIEAWAVGETNETTRDIVMAKLLGSPEDRGKTKHVTGTGMIPADRIGKVTWRSGVADLVDSVKIRHASGGWSMLGLKSYEQGWTKFQGTAKHVIWMDEEPPALVYDECVTRTMTTQGIVYITFTPLRGSSDVVLKFWDNEDAVEIE